MEIKYKLEDVMGPEAKGLVQKILGGYREVKSNNSSPVENPHMEK